ncbi:cupin [Sphingobacterium sp. N143]|uniref:cupin n=1 Tax=Sphingobacterium sp. N143 TaxID=2746727 RepID=UPI002577EDED|nr:cupin [Sphingobacterium sp. N143]MDM1294974.1 cupin [Sphingobacterium sp. N143]
MQTASIFQNITYHEKHPKMDLLLETESSKEYRLAFAKGQYLKEHKTAASIIVEIIDGCIDFGIKGSKTTLTKGMLVALEPETPHDLFAVTESIVRLSVIKQPK